MTVPAATVTQYYTGIFRQAPSAAVSAAYQAMADANAALNSMLSAANVQVDPVVRLYQTAFNRVPDSAGMTAWVVPYSTGAITLQAISNGFTQSTEFTTLYPTSLSNAQYVGALYWNILQRQGEDSGIQGWVNALNSGALTRAQVLLGFSESSEFKAKVEPNVNAFLTGAANNTASYTGSLYAQGGGATGPSYALTTGIDVQTASNFYGTVNAATGNTFTPGDQLTGSQGYTNTLTLADAGNAALTTALITPGGATLTNIQNLVINGNNVGNSVVSTTGALFSGLTGVTINEGGQVALTASGTQAVTLNLSATAGLVSSVDGGSTVNVTSAAVSANTATLNIGQTTAVTGAATATVTGTAYTAAMGATALGAINVRAGGTISVTETAFSSTTAAATDGAAGTRTLGAVAADGTSTTTAVTVTQTAAVNAQNYAAGSSTTYVTPGVAGVVNGAVVIRDATAIAGTQASAAGTIATVTLNNFGAASSISSNALTTLNLSGTGGTLGITTGLSAPANRTLTINTNAFTNRDGTTAGVNGANNTITDSTAPTGLGFTTLNIANTGSTRITGIAAVDATALNVSGAGTVTFSGVASGMATLASIVVTGTAGLSIASAAAAGTADLSTTVTSIDASGTSGNVNVNMSGLETKSTYTGGSGNDTVHITAAVTKAINGGSGTADVIVNNAAATDLVTGSPFITGFEILRAGALANGLTLNANGFAGLQVGATAGNVTFNNVAAGVALTIDASPTGTITYNLLSSTGTSDAVTINLNGTAAIAAGTVVTTGIETINIVTTDTPGASAQGAVRANAAVDSITLTDPTATSITVSGNAGLTLINTALTKVASFDASGVVLGTASLVAGGVTYTSATTKANSLTTTIKGGAGADVLTGGATADNIQGGAGSDTLAGGLGSDTIDGGTGTNTASWSDITPGANLEGVGTGTVTGVIVNLGSTAVAAATVNTAFGGTVGLSGSLASVASGSSAYVFTDQNVANSTVQDALTNIQNLVGTTGNDYFVGANGVANGITGGAGADVIVITETTAAADTVLYTTKAASAAAAGANMDVITGFVSGVDKINIQFSAATAASSTTGIASSVGTVGAMAGALADATAVANTAAVYTALAALIDNVVNPFAASSNLAGGTVAQVVTYANGAAAGTYLVINDNVAGFQAANDTVIKLVGTANVLATDFTYTYIA